MMRMVPRVVFKVKSEGHPSHSHSRDISFFSSAVGRASDVMKEDILVIFNWQYRVTQ